MRLLTLDPGPRNFGFSVSDFTDTGMKLLEVGQITSTITNLTRDNFYRKPTKAMRDKAKKKGVRLTKKDMPFEPPLNEGFLRFYKAFLKLVKDHRPDEIVVERFQSRGLRGPVIECISIMLGIILTVAHTMKIKVRLVIASQWKNAINKITNLEDFYTFGNTIGFTPHECDTLGMALYHMDTTYSEGTIEWATKMPKVLKRYYTSVLSSK